MNCANHLDRERVSFCQNCGKPLCLECSRTVGSAVFCEPCLAARLAGVPVDGQVPFTPVAGPGVGTVPLGARVAGAPNPFVAAVLGFIPGVGAMYNGQYAKAVVHLVVFILLVSLADKFAVIGMLVAGWIFYMAFEAYHTANARRLGTPLPNPFGLNDVGERMGFGKGWGTVVPPVQTAVPPTAFYQDVAGNQSYASGGAQFTQAAQGTQAYSEVGSASATAGTGWSQTNAAYTPVPPSAAYTAGVPVDPLLMPAANRFPTGAIILIVLGLLFFFGSTGFLFRLPIERLLPLFLIGLGVWLFLRKLTASGAGWMADGSAGYRLRIFQALRGSVWVVLVGVLFLLNDSGVLSWGHSWPLFIILAGVMTLLQRFAEGVSGVVPYPYGGVSPAPTPPVAETSTTIATTDVEGRS